MSQTPDPLLLKALARSFLAGEATLEQIVLRTIRTLGQPWPWLRPLTERYLQHVGGNTRLRQREVIHFLWHDSGLRRALMKNPLGISVGHWLGGEQKMQPVVAAQSWQIPSIESARALADWLAVSSGQLEWFADLKGLGYGARCPQLQHYHYRVLAKESGSVRLIEAPKPTLKELQRRILAGILEKIPPHRAAHGFLKGRSIKTFVAPHQGQRVVLRMDLRDFFPSFTAARIQTFFRTLGYPETVADLLGGICTNAVPRDAWRQSGIEIDSHTLYEAQKLYSRGHLPQGAPTSPSLANCCAYRIDCRLWGLARAAGAEYTRYADDLAFSGTPDFERRVDRFSTHVAAILFEEGFTVHHRKTRVMRQGVRQHLAGVVVNQHANVMRPDFDRLKAILTNCIRFGPDSQNRGCHGDFRSYLQGRVGFVAMVNPGKGQRLRTLFDQIHWIH